MLSTSINCAQRAGLGLVQPRSVRTPRLRQRNVAVVRALHQQQDRQSDEETLRQSARNADNVREKYTRGEPQETSDQHASDSYAQIEAPVRGTIPDRGPPVSERDWGQGVVNSDLKSDTWNPDKQWLGTKVGIVDSFRFAGAVPEVANCRLAMLGFALAVIGEATTGRNVFEQVGHAPGLVASIFALLIVATLVPVLRGVPRKGNDIWSSDAEIINGRVAMLGFLGLVLLSFYQGSYLGTLASWFT